MDKPLYHFEVSVKNCVAEAFLNGFPMRKLDGEKQVFAAIPANAFVKEGANTLELVIFPGPTPGTALNGPVPRQTAGASASVALTSLPPGAFPGEGAGETWGKLEWTGGQPAESYPKVLSGTCEVPQAYGPWVWESLPKVNLEGERAAILETVDRIHHAFKEGQAAALAAVSAIYFDEIARAYPAWDKAFIMQDTAQSIAKNIDRQDRIPDLEEDAFDFRVVGNGTLIECLDKQWRPVVRVEPNEAGEKYEFPFLLGKVEGAYQIIR